ncbi:FtsX-like permease family protein [Paramicrobacterium humi]|uniref:FtsX-like permease family protein n=1 Tax=Paramicrobacterium humi TaxID=640635 RepID=A0A1H4MEU9_9MICO|nr:FtsX-like permease family protein [Microbacterium humi]SEB80882.1 FtsX-like permease family protein [Microbacterium humi]
MTSLSTWAVLRRHLSALAGPMALLALVVALVSATAVASPRAIEATASADIAAQLSSLSPAKRSLRAEAGGTIALGTTADPLSGLRKDLDHFRSAMSEPFRAAAGSARFVLTTPEARVYATQDDPPTTPVRKLQLTAVSDRSVFSLTEGSWPGPVSRDADGVIHFDMVLSEEAAKQLGWTLGDTRLSYAGWATLTGIVTAKNPKDPIWSIAPNLLSPVIFDDGNKSRRVTGLALVDPALFMNRSDVDTLAWYPVDPGAIDAQHQADALASLRAFSAAPHVLTVPNGGVPTTLPFRSGAEAVLEQGLARQAAATTMIGQTAAGPVGVAVVVLALGIALLVARQRRSVATARARGASPLLLRGVFALEGLAIGAPAALVGAAVALLVPGSGVPLAVPVFLAILPAAVLAAVLPRDQPGARGGAARWIAEACVVIVTVAAVLASRSGAADALTALAPLGVAATVGIIVVRATTGILGGLARRAATRSGLAAFAGAARAARLGIDGPATILAVTIGCGIAVFAASLRASLTAAVDDTADSLIVAGFTAVVAASVIVSVAVAGVAVLLALTVTRAERRRFAVTIRMLGVSRLDSTAMTWWQIVPVVLAGVVGGLAVGLALPRAARPLDLSAFTGEAGASPLVVDAAATALIAAAFAVIVTVVQLIMRKAAAKADAAVVVRAEEE